MTVEPVGPDNLELSVRGRKHREGRKKSVAHNLASINQ